MEQKHLHAVAPFRAAQLTYPGNLREALRQAQEDPKKTMFGIGQGIPSLMLTKVLAATTPEFYWIDAEHSLYNRSDLYHAIQTVQYSSEGRTLVVIRVDKRDPVSLTTALDAGAAGIIIPHCESAEEVKEFIKEVYYPPMGHRSFSPWSFAPGVTDRSLYDNDVFNMTTSNKHVAVFAQIESVKGIENVDEIAALDGVHGLLFGPGDFMADAGLELKLGGEPHPVFADAMMKFVMAGKKTGKPLMAAVQSMDQVPAMIQQGFRALVLFLDVWGFSWYTADLLKKARDHSAQASEETKANGHAIPNGAAEPNGETQ